MKSPDGDGGDDKTKGSLLTPVDVKNKQSTWWKFLGIIFYYGQLGEVFGPKAVTESTSCHIVFLLCYSSADLNTT